MFLQALFALNSYSTPDECQEPFDINYSADSNDGVNDIDDHDCEGAMAEKFAPAIHKDPMLEEIRIIKEELWKESGHDLYKFLEIIPKTKDATTF